MKLCSRESAESYKIKFLLFTLALLLDCERCGEVFVEGEEVFYALAVAGEGVFAVAAGDRGLVRVPDRGGRCVGSPRR